MGSKETLLKTRNSLLNNNSNVSVANPIVHGGSEVALKHLGGGGGGGKFIPVAKIQTRKAVDLKLSTLKSNLLSSNLWKRKSWNLSIFADVSIFFLPIREKPVIFVILFNRL